MLGSSSVTLTSAVLLSCVDFAQVEKLEGRLEQWTAIKTALAEERKARARELHLTKDNYRAYQAEIRVKIPVGWFWAFACCQFELAICGLTCAKLLLLRAGS